MNTITYNGQTPVPQTESVPCPFCAEGYHIGTAYTTEDALWNARAEKGKCRRAHEMSDEQLRQIADNVQRANPDQWTENMSVRSACTFQRAADVDAKIAGNGK